LQLPAPPDWLQAVPLVGRKAASAWRALAASGPEELGRRIAPYAEVVSRWFLAEIGSFGVMAVEFLLTVVIAAILFAAGETVVTRVRRFARRLAGAPGESVVRLAGQAIRGVALGVVLVAIGQAVLGGIGLAVAGVPFAGILTALMLLLCLAQIGPAPVLLAGVIWLYWQGTAGWGTALLVWTIVVGTVDNVVRPILIMKGADLPLLLIFTGVVGGLLAFGLVGIFVGPMVLAVAYTLLEAWVCEEAGEPE
ncbi:MAG: AI-2E family transporter, partial [Gemmatimonadales bacterium]